MTSEGVNPEFLTVTVIKGNIPATYDSSRISKVLGPEQLRVKVALLGAARL